MTSQTALPTFDAVLPADFEKKAANTIRMLAADGVQAANSGHPGMPMGMALPALTLWTRFHALQPGQSRLGQPRPFRAQPPRARAFNAALLPAAPRRGYELPLEELRRFRHGAPRPPATPSAAIRTGSRSPRGRWAQDFRNGVGMAIAERGLAQLYNRPGFNVVDHYTYAIVSDGD